MPTITYPLAWLAVISLPLLAAIYFLRQRFRKQPVSSLLLWQMQKESREGGRRFETPKFPPIFFIELLILALLVFAALGPRWQLPHTTRPLIVVLDDSLSMSAGPAGQQPRDEALKLLNEILAERDFASYQLIAAGAGPRLLGDTVPHPNQLKDQISLWTCSANAADLDAALALARNLRKGDADVLVLTDHAPAETDLPPGRIRWEAVGKPRVNFAFVNAARTPHAAGDRCLFEVANLSASAATNTLRVTAGQQVVYEKRLLLETNRTHRVTLPVPATMGTLRAELGDDALTGDNQAALVRPRRRLVRVQMSVTDTNLAQLITETLAATGLRAPTNQPPELVIHQSDTLPAGRQAWGLHFAPVTEKAERFTGPFVMDTTHPLTHGLTLPGIVWGANATATNALGHLPIITAGNVPLVTTRSDRRGREQVTLHFAPTQSTVQDTPQWPALFWNLLHWRARAKPGLPENNLRLGAEVPYRPRGKTTTLTFPDKTEQQLDTPSGEIRLPVKQPGVYTVFSGAQTNRLRESFAVNFLAGAESNLSAAITDKWGAWGTEEEVRYEYASVLPYLILLALAGALAHLWMIARQRGRT